MKLVHPDLKCQLDFQTGNAQVWVIESPILLAKYTQELYAQIQGREGQFVLSAADEELPLEKSAEIIVDFFAVNINDRKIINKLYTELNECAVSERMYFQTREMITALQNYFLELEQCNPYMLEEEPEIDVLSILKLLGIRLADCADNFLENLLQYIKVSALLLEKRLLVLVNFAGFASAEQMNEVIKEAIYDEIKLLFIESVERDCFADYNRFIIDQDGCEIKG